MLNFSENNILLQQQLGDDINSSDNKDRKRLDDTRKNAAICKKCYLITLLNIATNFHKFLEAIPEQERGKIQNDLWNKNYFIEDSDGPEGDALTFVKSFYEFGIFLSSSPTDLIIVPHGETPHFVESKDIISSRSLYVNCNSSDSRGLVSVQFLAALNIYLGSNKQSSQNVMNEFLHNPSMQVLTRSYDAFWLEFVAMNCLTREINLL